MKNHGGTLNAYYQVKEANIKRLHVYDYIYITYTYRIHIHYICIYVYIYIYYESSCITF